jgi:hypothetical protein
MRQLLYRVSVVIIAAWALALLPSPSSALPLPIKNTLVVVVAILYSGKLLYDTLFFDRYRP